MRCGQPYETTATTTPPARGLARLSLRARLRGDGTDLFYVIVAAILAVVLSHLPFINAVVYPFKLFATFVHEWCHALVAIATGGQVLALQINPSDFSGETLTSGGWLLPIFSAGYTGAAIVGALLLLIPTRFANRTLLAVGATSLLMPFIGALLFGTNFTVDTWIWAAIFGSVTLLVGWRGAPRVARIFQQFVAVELCFTSLDSLRQLAWLSANSPNTRTDAYNAQHYLALHLPEMFWSIVWALIALTAIAFAVRQVVRRSLV
jgi:hypothetical protein